jgi:acetolactate synthase-1/2/3 large subunit
MQTGLTSRTGGQILIDQLRIQGVDLIFGVPGESYLAALDALADAPDLRFILCRQEAGAANMAEAYGKLTGRPGICFVTRGPGATQASIGCHNAFQDSTPMILLIGQVGRAMMGREAFQEIDYTHMFGPMAKWVAQIEDPARIPEFVARAFAVATSGRPGPVVLSLPEDMLTSEATVADAVRYRPARPKPGETDLVALRGLLAQAKKPFVLIGGGTWSRQAATDLAAFAKANRLPVAASFRCQDYIDNDDPSYIGHVGIGVNKLLAARLQEADLILCIGARLGESTTGGYTLLVPPKLRQTLVHVFPDPEELGRVYQPDLPIVASSAEFLAAVRSMPPIEKPIWKDWRDDARADYVASLVPPKTNDSVDLGAAIVRMREILPQDAIVTNGAGNFTSWLHRYFRYRGFRTQLGPTNGAMGYGVPSGIAAKLLKPDQPVVAVCGDGDFMMTGQELATAVHHGIPVVFLIVNNSLFGTIRMHQEREYPGRPFATTLTNPDFAKLAEAYGAFGRRVETTDQFEPALREALACGRPAVLDVITDPETILPGVKI